MKCPYRKRTVHQPDRYKDGRRCFAVDIEEYAECHEKECPFYREGTCMKADSDMRGDRMKDLIERQTAIDVVKRLMGDSELSRTVQTGMHILPSAKPDEEQEIKRLRELAARILGKYEEEKKKQLAAVRLASLRGSERNRAKELQARSEREIENLRKEIKGE